MNIRMVATAVLLCAPISVLTQMVSIPEPIGYVNDFANQLKPGQRKALDDKLKAYEQKSTIQFVVYVTPSLGGESKEQFAQAITDKWKIGKKGKDNGLLLLWAPTERQYFLEVGFGLEGSLTDGAAGQILRDHLVPHLKMNQGYEGLDETVDAVIMHLGDQTEAPPLNTTENIYREPWFWIVCASGLFLLGLTIYFGIRRDSSVDDTESGDSPEQPSHLSDRQRPGHIARSRTSHYTERLDDTESPSVNAAAAIVAAETLSRSERNEESGSESHTSEESESDDSSTSSSFDSSSTTSDFSGGGGDMGGGGAGGSY